MISGDDRQVCHRLLQRLALARRAMIGKYFPPILWPMTLLQLHSDLDESFSLFGGVILKTASRIDLKLSFVNPLLIVSIFALYIAIV